MLTNIDRLYCDGGRRLERVCWGCAMSLLLGFGVVVTAVALLSLVMLVGLSVGRVCSICCMYIGFWECKGCNRAIGLCCVCCCHVHWCHLCHCHCIIVVCIMIVISLLLHCEGFWGYITWMLATRAARLMFSGGSLREIKVLWVLDAVVMFDDGLGNASGSWLMKCQPLKFSVVICTVL